MSKIFYANIINPNILQSTVLDPVSNPMASNLDLGMNQIINIGEASDPNGVPTLSQVNSLIASSVAFSGDATFNLNMNNKDIQNVKQLGFQIGNTTSTLSCDGNGNLMSNNSAMLITDQNIRTYITPGFTGDIDMNDHNINNVKQIEFADGSSNSLTTMNNNLVYNGNTVLTTQNTPTILQTLNLISEVIPFVGSIKIGMLNYYKGIYKTIDWAKFLSDAVKILRNNGMDDKFYIKKNLNAYNKGVYLSENETNAEYHHL